MVTFLFMLVNWHSEDSQPPEGNRHISDQHRNCSRCQQLVVQEGARWSPQREVHTDTLTSSPSWLLQTDEQLLLSCILLTFFVKSARFRLETLERENQITQEKFEEVAQGWSEALDIVIPQDLEESINRQKGLCRVIIEDKERLVAELQNVKLPS